MVSNSTSVCFGVQVHSIQQGWLFPEIANRTPSFLSSLGSLDGRMATWWISGMSCVKHPRLVLYINRQCVVNSRKKRTKKKRFGSAAKTNWFSSQKEGSLFSPRRPMFNSSTPRISRKIRPRWPRKTIDGCTRPVDQRQASRNQSRPEQSPGQSRRNQSRIASRCGCDFGVLKHGKVTHVLQSQLHLHEWCIWIYIWVYTDVYGFILYSLIIYVYIIFLQKMEINWTYENWWWLLLY